MNQEQIVTQENGATFEENAVFHADPWLDALRHVAQHYRLPISMQAARQAARWSNLETDREKIGALARTIGLRVKFAEPGTIELSSWQLPLIARLRGGQVGVVKSLGAAGEASVILHGDRGLETPIPIEELLRNLEAVVIPRPARAIPDARVDAYIRPYEDNWLRRIILRDLRPYGHVMLASLVANSLGLAGILFSMQVYDRVVPAESFNTLYLLFGGVLLAVVFDFIMRRLRMNIIDLLGKRADLRISDRVLGHALRVRNRARPASTGTFIAQLRDLEQVRDMLTSTTVAALADIPFFLLFLVVFWYIGGTLVLVPIGALLLLVIPGLLAQRRLRGYASEAMRESSLRNAMLVEAVQGIEDIKTLQAEERFQQQWNHFNAVTGEVQIKLRSLTNTLTVWTHNVQTGVFAVVVLLGAPMVMEGDMTTGALVAASVLGSRMMAPMAQITQVMSRLQQAKVGAESLNQIMRMPIDHPEQESRIHCPRIMGGFNLKSAVFRYGDDTSPAALAVRDLRINPGEKIAVLGKNGAGKSTLLQALSGLLEPSSGEVLLDDMALQQIDPADVRRDVGMLTQNARLFHGTLRDNIMMGAPHASQEEILGTLSMVGADEFIRKLPRGLEHVVLEGGHGLSGGQKQAILLARLLIRQPNVVLLDEPTASMDEATERHFIQRFMGWSGERTVVIATHRMRVLELADRILVVENGLIALDDTKEAALRVLRGLANVKPASAKEHATDRSASSVS
nr:type I secretion system permease/ATPase [Aquamicrobium sp. LC103]